MHNPCSPQTAERLSYAASSCCCDLWCSSSREPWDEEGVLSAEVRRQPPTWSSGVSVRKMGWGSESK